MPERYVKPYIESAALISWVKGEKEKGVERDKIVDHIIQQAERGHFPIYTSTLSIAEVVRRRNSPPLDDSASEEVLAWFEQPYVQLIVVDRLIAEDANRICRKYGVRPNDAIHLASALRAGCEVLLTWDEAFVRRLEQVPHPDISVELPQMLGQLSLDIPEQK